VRAAAASVAGRLRPPPLGSLLRRAASARVRRHLLVGLAIATALAAVYLFWLRDASFVRVEKVSVTGASTADAARVRKALTLAATTMTTLHVDHERLERAVSGYPAVQSLEVDADLPNALHIRVVEHRPAAVVVSGRGRVAVAGEGAVLRGLEGTSALPAVRIAGPLPDERLDDARALRAVAVAAAAPRALLGRLLDVRERAGKGLVVRMRRGPELIFGSATGLEAKWLAAARVLADRSSRGATYIDLRLPSRPAAGGVAKAPEPPPAAAPAPATPPQAPAPVAPQAAPQPGPTAPQAPATGPPQAPAQGTPAPTPTAPQAPPANPQP
jgi:cell division protein FtsQ